MDNGYQRILDMAKRAGIKGRDELYLSPAELEFAESIIIECAGIAHNNIHDPEDANQVPRMIFDFFGIK